MGIWDRPKPAVLAAVTILSEAFGQWAEVSTKLPARNRPDRFVTVTRVGGGLSDEVTDTARILVHCYAKSTHEVEEMTATARAGLRNSAHTKVVAKDSSGDVFEEFFIRRYSESGVADLPHPDVLDFERWQFVAELSIAINRYTSRQ